MDALLLSLLLCAWTEIFGKQPLLFGALQSRFAGAWQTRLGLVAAIGANAAVAAWAAGLLNPALTPEARRLLLALALLFAAVTIWWRLRKPDLLEGWSLGPFATACLGLFILGFGESWTFLIVGIAVAFADPWMAAVGGALGTMAACALMPVLPETSVSQIRGPLSRQVTGALYGVTAFSIAMASLRLL